MMTLSIILFVMVLLGMIMFAYALNKQRNENRERAVKEGKDVREGRAGNL